MVVFPYLSLLDTGAWSSIVYQQWHYTKQARYQGTRDGKHMNRVQFEAELIEGHKGVTVVIVPFDPEEQWSMKPVRLEGRRHGWLVVGSVNGVRFDGYIGERWNRFFIIMDRDLRDAANVAVGDTLKVSIEPTASAMVFERARHQSKVTTAPKIVRADAIDM